MLPATAFTEAIDGSITWVIVQQVMGQFGAPDPSRPYIVAMGFGLPPSIVAMADVHVDGQGRTRWFRSGAEAHAAAREALTVRVQSRRTAFQHLSADAAVGYQSNETLSL